MPAMLFRLFRFFIGFLLVPFCVAATRTVMALTQTIPTSSDALIPPSALALGGGFVVWLLVFYTLPRPVRTYVLAHELTHALWGWLMGARVLGMSISKERGSVTLSKTNFLIILAPYFFPLYTALVVGTYYILSIFYNLDRYYPVWLFLVGFTWGFHFTFTITALMLHQTDVRECGHLFSYAVIYLFNILGIGLWIVMVSAVSLQQMIGFLANDFLYTGGRLVRFSLLAAQTLGNLISHAINRGG